MQKMPKKFAQENSKAVAAKARKNEKASAEKAEKERAAEDAKWQDDGCGLAKKQNKKDEAEKKRLEALERKKERQLLEEEEMANIKSGKVNDKSGKKTGGGPSSKLTRQQIMQNMMEQAKKAAEEKTKKDKKDEEDDSDLIENVNRLTVDGDEARNLDEAISILSGPEKAEKHPEKRMKAAYEDFEKERLPELKAENPNLRLSQLKQILRKEWLKHPSNPFNQKTTGYNTKSK